MSDDLIRRKDAIKGLARLEPYVVNVYGATIVTYSNKELQTMLRAIPSADRPQEWIPCDKELPALMIGVLGTDEYGYIRHVYRAIRHGKSRFETVEEGIGINILAWMPLPEPWKGADDE